MDKLKRERCDQTSWRAVHFVMPVGPESVSTPISCQSALQSAARRRRRLLAVVYGRSSTLTVARSRRYHIVDRWRPMIAQYQPQRHWAPRVLYQRRHWMSRLSISRRHWVSPDVVFSLDKTKATKSGLRLKISKVGSARGAQ